MLTFDTPILFLIFNRPNVTQKVFNQIRKIKPRRLFIAGDGPRKSVGGDLALCLETRKIVNLIDWECDFKTLFQKENLGCQLGVSTAINWFFKNVEAGIILEDDCLPDLSFFHFCRNLINKYFNDDNIMMIAGTSYFFGRVQSLDQYFLSKYYAIWGWATWRSAWKKFEFNLTRSKIQKNEQLIKSFIDNKYATKFLLDMLYRVADGDLNTWDVRWALSCILNKGYCITPFNNLISNIGIDGAHANGKADKFHFMPVIKLPEQTRYLKNIRYNSYYDNVIYKEIGLIPDSFIRCLYKKVFR